MTWLYGVTPHPSGLLRGANRHGPRPPGSSAGALISSRLCRVAGGGSSSRAAESHRDLEPRQLADRASASRAGEIPISRAPVRAGRVVSRGPIAHVSVL